MKAGNVTPSAKNKRRTQIIAFGLVIATSIGGFILTGLFLPRSTASITQVGVVSISILIAFTMMRRTEEND